MMKRLLAAFVALWMGGIGPALAVADEAPAGPVAHETPAAPAARIRHATVLKFSDGSYTSIFGLVPKKYKLGSEESREIVQTFDGTGGFTLDLVASDARRILSLPEETPTVESAPKPLTGKSIRVFKEGGDWEYEVVGHESPSPEEEREAQRLMRRFQTDASPFKNPAWDADGTAPLELTALLRFLGYMDPENLHGSAVLKRKPDGPKTGAALQLEASFDSGEGTNRIAVELKGTGTLDLSDQTPYYRKVRIDGDLVIHGIRELQDGRKVPYSLITPFSYETSVATDSAS